MSNGGVGFREKLMARLGNVQLSEEGSKNESYGVEEQDNEEGSQNNGQYSEEGYSNRE